MWLMLNEGLVQTIRIKGVVEEERSLWSGMKHLSTLKNSITFFNFESFLDF